MKKHSTFYLKRSAKKKRQEKNKIIPLGRLGGLNQLGLRQQQQMMAAQQAPASPGLFGALGQSY